MPARAGTVIRIATGGPDDGVQLSVGDEGVGESFGHQVGILAHLVLDAVEFLAVAVEPAGTVLDFHHVLVDPEGPALGEDELRGLSGPGPGGLDLHGRAPQGRDDLWAVVQVAEMTTRAALLESIGHLSQCIGLPLIEGVEVDHRNPFSR